MNDQAMTILGTVLLGALALPLALASYRMLKGPGPADRFVAFDMLTGVAVAFSALTSMVTGSPSFLEVGLGAALINFVATCAFASFLERKRKRQ